MNYIDQIASLWACRDAVGWLHEANHPTPQAAWNACSRPDWMLWLLGACANRGIVVNRRGLIIIVADIAGSTLRYVPTDEARPRFAIETIRRWACGEATIKEVKSAHRALQSVAHFVYDATFTAAAADAVEAANYAIDAAETAVCATLYAAKAEATPAEIAFAVSNAAHTADYATLAHARSGTHDFIPADYANIVRRYFPNPPALESV